MTRIKNRGRTQDQSSSDPAFDPRSSSASSASHCLGAPMTAPTIFNAIPGQGDLAQFERDLSFHPCTNSNPAVLTREQIERFNRDGYLMPVRIFSPAEI